MSTHEPQRPFNSDQLEAMLRRGWAALAYFDSDGTFHVGLIERDVIEVARRPDAEGEEPGGVMFALTEAKTKPGLFAAGMLTSLDEVVTVLVMSKTDFSKLPTMPLDRGLQPYSDAWFQRELETHPARDVCHDAECMICSWRDCPHHEPLHYDTDGPCPSCNDGDAA